MKAVFITTPTADCASHVRGWTHAFGPPAAHLTFQHTGLRNTWRYIEQARELKPDIIFYIGAQEGRGNPRMEDLQELRAIAPLINLCSDAQDKPWHKTLEMYSKHNSFDLQVALDGARDAPVDLAVLTPVDADAFASRTLFRDIRCGFSGSVGRWNPRSELLLALKWFAGLEIRQRSEADDSYAEHAAFMSRCQIIINSSVTGTGRANHIKGRVLEAGWAGCALLEDAKSPISLWFPEDCYFTYTDPPSAAEVISGVSDAEIQHCAERLHEEVRSRFTARQIYQEIIDRVRRT